MERLIADHALRESMAEAATKRSRSFTADVVVPRIESIYHEAVARRRGGGQAAR
jgi:hypothetical protein